MSIRDRSEGWQHAKLSGHENEEIIKDLLRSDSMFQMSFLNRIGMEKKKILRVSAGGLGQSHVPSVFQSGDMTTPKADLHIEFDDQTYTTVSIKKSLAGQVYLVTIENFIEAYESHFEPIPQVVKHGIRLYWGNDAETLHLIEQYGTHRNYEFRKHRLVASTLRHYDMALYNSFFNWFVDNTFNISELCFARGGAKYRHDWAEFVWYLNKVDDITIDSIFRISDISSACHANAQNTTFFGNINGGSTLQLPFGFVQWHSPQKTIPGSLQFHHKYKSISDIVKRG